MSNLSQEEKLNYIYSHLKNQKRAVYISYGFKAVLFLLFISLYFYIANNFTKEEIIKKVGTEIGIVSRPIVDGLMKEMKLDLESRYKDLKGKTTDSVKDSLVDKIKNNKLLKDKFIK